MKPTTAQINTFLNSPSPDIRVILLYGPDSGLVSERGTTLAKKSVPDIQDPFSVSRLAQQGLQDDPARLVDEMAAQSLMGGRRLVWIQHVTDALTPSLSTLLKGIPSNDSILILEAGDLEKKSKLRQACEASDIAMAIPCYREDGPARSRTITDILKSEGFTISPPVANHLAHLLPPDRLAMRSELDKLALYARGQSSISEDDITAVLADAGSAEMDDLTLAIGLGDGVQAARLIDRLYAEQTSSVALLRAAQRHFLRLLSLRHHVDKGLSPTDAVKRLQPPVFWKHEAAFVKSIGRWSTTKLDKALVTLYEAEAAVKRTGVPDTALCAQTLLSLAR